MNDSRETIVRSNVEAWLKQQMAGTKSERDEAVDFVTEMLMEQEKTMDALLELAERINLLEATVAGMTEGKIPIIEQNHRPN